MTHGRATATEPERGPAGSGQWPRIPVSVPLLLFGFGVLVLIIGTWSESGLTDPDEFRRILRTPIEMMERDSWLTPWLDGQPRLQKPPLIYWLVIISYKALGITLFSGRLWSVLFGAGFAVCCALIHREVSRSDGLLAGLVALGTIAVAIQGRVAMLDIPLAFFSSLAIWLALRWGRKGTTVWILLSSLALGLAFLTKGPVAFLIVVPAALAAVMGFQKWGFVLSHWRQVLAAAALCLAICLPWPLVMAVRWPDFLPTLTEEIVEQRALGSLIETPWSLMLSSLGLVFPWTPAFIGALLYYLRPSRLTTHLPYRWLVLWYFMTLIPFMFMETYERYLIPLIPCMAALCAGRIETTKGRSTRILIGMSLCFAALAAIPFIFIGLWFRLGVVWAWVSVVLAMGLVVMALRPANPRLAAGAVAVHFAVLLGGLYPSFGIEALPSGLREVVADRPILLFETRHPHLLSVELGQKVVRVTSNDLEERFTQVAPEAIVFLRKGKSPKFTESASDLGLTYRLLGQFTVLPSRPRLPRFGRWSSTREDWEHAIETRSLDGLRIQIRYYRLTARPSQLPRHAAQ